jgi:hypothetical protein
MATKVGFVVALVLFVSALLLTGCGHEVAHYKGAQVEITVHPWKTTKTAETVKLVSKSPDPTRYVFVGRVDGAAQQDLREKAAALGADVVKIDRKGVLVAGRAYKLIGTDTVGD